MQHKTKKISNKLKNMEQNWNLPKFLVLKLFDFNYKKLQGFGME